MPHIAAQIELWNAIGGIDLHKHRPGIAFKDDLT
jgi:hypothetical protein